jgi:ATP synthase F1 epsilon subunit|tara:strand:+ start:639 stop:1037 length:399 start_codon:yes stop_codon:yes gene_type:complete
MSEQFNLEIVSPEKSFLKKDNVTEVVVPAFEGEMGILKDHISIISFLKPGVIKITSGSEEENFYVDDGIVEFKDNSLSILTSNIFDIKNSDKAKIQEMIKQAEGDLSNENLDDQKRFIISQRLEVLKSLSLN